MRPPTPPALPCTNCGTVTTGPILRWGSSRREHVVCQVCCGPDFEFNLCCSWCERPFRYSGQGRRRYCTERCRRQASALRTGRLGPAIEVPCGSCGRTFIGRRADAVYCSSSCRQQAYRRRRQASG